MVNTRAKGRRNQNKAIKWLEEKGYRVAIAERTGKFIKEKDAFGLADLIAIKKNLVVFVQVTTNKPHSHKPYKEFAKKYCGDNLLLWQVVFKDHDKMVYVWDYDGE